MAATAPHRSRVLASPWAGVHATDIDSARHYGRHWHSTYAFGVIEHGAHRSASGRGDVDAFAGDVVCTYPGEVHDGRPLGSPTRRWRNVYVEPAVFESIGEAASEPRRGAIAFTRAAFRDARAHHAITYLLAQLESWTRADARARASQLLACDEALTQACGLMLRDHSTALRQRDGDTGVDLSRVCQRLADAPADAPTLDELAALAGIGKFQLLRRFRNAYGTTPHDWLLQQRADRARGLIRQGVALGEAAASAGFADQSHMTRVFMQRFGFTPGAWRDAH
jgi:AraC-like DNA-binding protein